MILKFLPILLLTFVNIIGFTLLIPVLPEVALAYADPAWYQVIYGSLLSAYSLFQFLAAPLLGSASDKFGRKPILLVSQLGTALSWVIFALAYFVPNLDLGIVSLPLLVIGFSRVIDGITGGNISVAQAWISDMTTRAEKTKAFGLMGGVFGLGFLLGPALGGLSSSGPLGYLGTCILALLISILTLLVMWWRLPESLPESKREVDLDLHFWSEINLLKKLQGFSHNQFVMSLIRTRFSFVLVFGAFATLIILYLNQFYSLSSLQLGLLLSSIGIFSIFNQAIVVPFLAKQWGDFKVFYAGMLAFIMTVLVYPLLPTPVAGFGWWYSLGVFMLVSFGMNLSISLSVPTFKSLLVHSVSDRKQGLATGIDEALIAFGNSVSPILAGLLYASIEVFSFWVFGLILFVPFIYNRIKFKKLVLAKN